MNSVSRRSFIVSCATAAAALAALPQALSAAPEKRIALLIASGKFPKKYGITALFGPKHDVGMMAHLLEYKYGFRRENIWILGLSASERQAAQLEKGYRFLDSEAHSAAISNAIGDLRAALSVGSYGVLYYSGHGASIPDPARPRDSGLTQYWIAADAKPHFDFQNEMLTAGVEGFLAMIVDCCHSGGTARGPNDDFVIKSGHLPEDEVQSALRGWQGHRPDPKLEYFHEGNRTFLSATDSREAAVEINLPYQEDPIFVGAFTWSLYQILMHTNGLTYGAALQMVSERLRRLGSVLGHVPEPDVSGNHKRLLVAPMSAGLPIRPGSPPLLHAGWLCGIRADTVISGSRGVETAQVKQVSRYVSTLQLRSGKIEDLRQGYVAFQPYQIRSGRTVRRKGDDMDKTDKPEDKIVEGGVQLFVDQEGDTYSVKEKRLDKAPLTILDGIATNDAARKKRDEIALGVRTGNDIRRTLVVDFLPTDPFLLRLSTKESEQGEAYPRYATGPLPEDAHRFDLKVRSQQAGYLFLMSCEPDGAINILYPNWRTTARSAYRLEYHNGTTEYPMAATPPYGLTTLIAVLLDAPLELPRDLLKKPENPEWVHHSIPTANVPAFLRWLGQAMAKLPPTEEAEGRGRGTGVPAGLSPQQLEEQQLISVDRVAVEQFAYLCVPRKMEPQSE